MRKQKIWHVYLSQRDDKKAGKHVPSGSWSHGMRRSPYHKCNKDQHGSCRKADRVDQHDRLKCPVCREYSEDPQQSDAAYTDDGKDSRQKGNPEPAEVARHILIQHTEYVGKKYSHKSGITDIDNLWVTVEDSQQTLTKEQNQSDCRSGGNGIFNNA